MIDVDELHKIFNVDYELGILFRIRLKGKPAGSLHKPSGRWMVHVNGSMQYRAKIIYAMYHGYWPTLEIDHFNQGFDLRSDDSISNLRELTSLENHKNRTKQSNNLSGVTGVHWDKGRSKWMAYIKVNYHRKHLGRFINKLDAICARKSAEVNYGFTNL